MARAKGLNTITYVGSQVDKSTKATTYLSLLAKSANMQANVEKIQSEALDGNSFQKRGAVVGYDVQGDTNIEYTKDSLLALLPYAGFTDSLGVWKLQSSIASWATVVTHLTDATEEREFIGCKINSLEIDLALKSYMGVNVSWQGLDYNYNNTLTALTSSAPVDSRVKTTSATIAINIDGTDRTALISSMTLGVNNNLELDQVLGQVAGEDLDSGNPVEVTAKCTALFDKTMHQDLLTKLDSETLFAIAVVLETGVTVDLPACEIENVSAPIESAGNVEVSFDIKAIYDVTEATAMVITVV